MHLKFHLFLDLADCDGYPAARANGVMNSATLHLVQLYGVNAISVEKFGLTFTTLSSAFTKPEYPLESSWAKTH